MKKQLLLSLALALPMAAPAMHPALANHPTPVGQQTSVARAVVPQSTGLAIMFPAEVTVDVGQKQEYPLTVPLAQAILDTQGNVVAPEGTAVSIKIKPSKGGGKIVAEFLLLNSQVIPVQASSSVIPGFTVTKKSANQKAVENRGVFGSLAGSIMGFAGGRDPGRTADGFDRGAMLGSAVGIVSGLTAPENVRLVQIPQGSVYVLPLQAPLALNSTPAAAQAQPQAQPAAAGPQFQFKNAHEYSLGLEKVLQAYQAGELSKPEALGLIEGANTYATTRLSAQLYPPLGQRQRIQQLFDFVYDIDQKSSASIRNGF